MIARIGLSLLLLCASAAPAAATTVGARHVGAELSPPVLANGRVVWAQVDPVGGRAYVRAAPATSPGGGGATTLATGPARGSTYMLLGGSNAGLAWREGLVRYVEAFPSYDGMSLTAGPPTGPFAAVPGRRCLELPRPVAPAVGNDFVASSDACDRRRYTTLRVTRLPTGTLVTTVRRPAGLVDAVAAAGDLLAYGVHAHPAGVTVVDTRSGAARAIPGLPALAVALASDGTTVVASGPRYGPDAMRPRLTAVTPAGARRTLPEATASSSIALAGHVLAYVADGGASGTRVSLLDLDTGARHDVADFAPSGDQPLTVAFDGEHVAWTDRRCDEERIEVAAADAPTIAAAPAARCFAPYVAERHVHVDRDGSAVVHVRCPRACSGTLTLRRWETDLPPIALHAGAQRLKLLARDEVAGLGRHGSRLSVSVRLRGPSPPGDQRDADDEVELLSPRY